MTADVLKRKIKQKFGSFTNFGEAIDVDRYVLQKELLQPQKVKKDVITKYAKLCEDTTGHKLTDENIELLKAEIEEYGGVKLFCECEELIGENELFKLFRGERKLITPKLEEVFEFFEIKV